MLKKIFLLLVVAIAAFAGVAALQPADFRVVRKAQIDGPPATVFPHVNELKKWDEWSPWAKLDPNAKNSFEGPPGGPGSSMFWSGNSQVGEGRMTIVESFPNRYIKFRLDFIRPFAATSMAEFNFEPNGDKTTVTWSMSGTKNFISKAIGLIMDCDKMIGGQFEQGLAQLNTAVKSNPK